MSDELVRRLIADVAHDDQVGLWADELSFDLQDDLREMEDHYDAAIERDEHLRWAARKMAVKVLTHPALTDRIRELEAANRGLVRLNEATEARAVTAETALAASEAKVARLVDAGENVAIAYGMGWDMDGVMEVLRAALASVRAQEGEG